MDTTNETKIEWTKNTYESLRGFRDCFENLSVDEVLEKAKRVNDRFFEEDTRRRAR
jgi:hypothetical protein